MSTGAVDYFSSEHPLRRLASKVAWRARQSMYRLFVAQLAPTADDEVIDIGVTPDQELPDSNFFERLYPWPERVTATSIEDASAIEARFPGVRFVRTPPGPLPFDDRAFEIAFCSAVLEHVGPENQRAFLAEVLRVSGGRCFVTTPNRWFPVEVHTFLPLLHWLPRSAHRRLLHLLRRPFWADPANLHLVSARELAALFPADARVRILRKRTLGLTSNLRAVAEGARAGQLG